MTVLAATVGKPILDFLVNLLKLMQLIIAALVTHFKKYIYIYIK